MRARARRVRRERATTAGQRTAVANANQPHQGQKGTQARGPATPPRQSQSTPIMVEMVGHSRWNYPRGGRAAHLSCEHRGGPARAFRWRLWPPQPCPPMRSTSSCFGTCKSQVCVSLLHFAPRTRHYRVGGAPHAASLVSTRRLCPLGVYVLARMPCGTKPVPGQSKRTTRRVDSGVVQGPAARTD